MGLAGQPVMPRRQRLGEVLGEPGLRVVRRRGGGGAVLLDPLDSIWIDLWLPSNSPGYLDDVRGQLELVGTIIREALGVAGLFGLALATPVVVFYGPALWAAYIGLIRY